MSLTLVHPAVADYWADRRSVLGAFADIDFIIFDRLLADQASAGIRGDILEIGALYGKSAIVLGLHARSPEKVYICDIFEASTADEANDLENAHSYGGLSRTRFEETYARFVNTEPVVIQSLSDTITEHVPAATLRFAHIDGGHLYDVVKADIDNVRGLLTPDGVMVLDDFRALHTPGVAAATWAAVVSGGLIPIVVSEQKFYGTYSQEAADSLRAALVRWAGAAEDQMRSGVQSVAGHEVLVLANPEIPSVRQKVRTFLPPVVADALRGKMPPPPHLGA